ncbi:MAG TPA: hypothetical protein VFI46_11275 [Jiangellaceae bacterium]|nr:hypothetical protein [Jiangellaceae bacterium]
MVTEAWTDFANHHGADLLTMADSFVDRLMDELAMRHGKTGDLVFRAQVLDMLGPRSESALPLLQVQVDRVEAVKIAQGFAMDDLVVAWANQSRGTAERVSFMFELVSAEHGERMLVFDSASHDRFVTLQPGETRAWSLIELFMSGENPLRLDLRTKAWGTVYVGSHGGFRLTMDAVSQPEPNHQPVQARRLEARFRWETSDPFCWELRDLQWSMFDRPDRFDPSR